MPKTKNKKLTLKQQLFCRYYVLGFWEESDMVIKNRPNIDLSLEEIEDEEDAAEAEEKIQKSRTWIRLGNAVRSYAKAFCLDPEKHYGTCSTMAWRLLEKAEIQQYMDELLKANGFNDRAMDARLNEIAMNGQDKNSLQALKHYNELKRRIDPVQAPVTVHVDLDGRAAELVKKYKDARFPDTDKKSK